MEPFRDDNDLAATLRALRPAPRQAFAAELDERAATGFPRRPTLAEAPLGRLFAGLRALPTQRLVLAGGATALAAVAVATVVVASSKPRASRPSQTAAIDRHQRTYDSSLNLDGSGPSLHHRALRPTTVRAASASGGAAVQAAPLLSSRLPESAGPFAAQIAHRDVERAAQLVLGAEAAEIDRDAAKVFAAVHSYHGIVLSSSIRDGGEGEASARFELLIPGARVGDALAALSAIDEVRSRNQSTADITAPTVRIGERLRDSRGKVEGLLKQLAAADSNGERAATEAELQAARRQATSLRTRLSALRRRANLARVSVRIETGDAPTSSGDSGGSWGAGDALGDAGHILGIVAGIAIVSLAVLIPLALIVLLLWLANGARVRRRREGALG